ncbi:unnamed protein product [Urochloa humidicola]
MLVGRKCRIFFSYLQGGNRCGTGASKKRYHPSIKKEMANIAGGAGSTPLKLDPKLGRLRHGAPVEVDAVNTGGTQVRGGFDTIQRGCDKISGISAVLKQSKR